MASARQKRPTAAELRMIITFTIHALLESSVIEAGPVLTVPPK
jgi:hypothetical protein